MKWPRSSWLLPSALLLTSAFSIQPSALPASPAALPVQALRSVSALPPHVAGTFREIAACHVSPEGDLIVFDRRAHAAWLVPAGGTPREIVQIGVEPGRILMPVAFDSAPDGTFVIADAPYLTERVQIFFYRGGAAGGFTVPGRSTPRVALGNDVLSGVGSLDYTGKTVLVSRPESGALVTEYALDGKALRSFGELRATGSEQEQDLHLSLNAGLPLAIPGDAGFYFVFLAGVPTFRRYDAAGKLLFERHIQGVELDSHLRALPKAWPKRKTAEGEFPIVPPTVRTAAIDRDGHLWLSLVSPYTYVYDTGGDKVRTVQFHGAGIMSPSNLHFTPQGQLITAPGCYTFNPKAK